VTDKDLVRLCWVPDGNAVKSDFVAAADVDFPPVAVGRTERRSRVAGAGCSGLCASVSVNLGRSTLRDGATLSAAASASSFCRFDIFCKKKKEKSKKKADRQKIFLAKFFFQGSQYFIFEILL
jgi:hypothetical protein